MALSNKRLFQNRIAKRKYKHGNWRQVVVDCGGICVYKDPDGNPCCSTEYLEFHEPFGEDHYGWGMFQARILYCFLHHSQEHPENSGVGNSRKTGNTLNSDIDLEISIHGGWNKWIKDFNLVDTFGRLWYV